jgi:hypothetical protein
MFNRWIAFSFQAARLGWEAQNVIVLRLLRLAGGSDSGQTEARRMIAEKMSALTEAQAVVTSVALQGGSGHTAAKRVLNVYKKRVRANRRRLSK